MSVLGRLRRRFFAGEKVFVRSSGELSLKKRGTVDSFKLPQRFIRKATMTRKPISQTSTGIKKRKIIFTENILNKIDKIEKAGQEKHVYFIGKKLSNGKVVYFASVESETSGMASVDSSERATKALSKLTVQDPTLMIATLHNHPSYLTGHQANFSAGDYQTMKRVHSPQQNLSMLITGTGGFKIARTKRKGGEVVIKEISPDTIGTARTSEYNDLITDFITKYRRARKRI